ncbi:MAG: hypothetical protein COS76_02165, partial [Candidatus Portnoybacteria bacterium CG06_land_8_20_14_3_00_39_12]
MPQYEVKKVNIWSFSRTTGLIGAIVYGVGYVLFGGFMLLIYILQNSGYYSGPPLVSFVIALPVGILGIGLAGLAIGAVTGCLFNLIAP